LTDGCLVHGRKWYAWFAYGSKHLGNHIILLSLVFPLQAHRLRLLCRKLDRAYALRRHNARSLEQVFKKLVFGTVRFHDRCPYIGKHSDILLSILYLINSRLDCLLKSRALSALGSCMLSFVLNRVRPDVNSVFC